MFLVVLLGLVPPSDPGLLGDDGPASKLIALLGDRETQNPDGKPGMRPDLAAAVHHMGDRKVETMLRLFKESKDGEVRRGVSFVLGEIGDCVAVPVLLDDHLREGRSVVQERDLGKFDDPRVVRAYVGMLQSENEEEQVRASIGMINLRAKSALPILLPLLKDDETRICANAVEGVGAIGDASAVPALIKSLDDANDGVVIFAAQALGRIGDPHATRPLKQRLTKGRPDFWVRKAVREALADIAARLKPAKAPQPAR